MNQNASIRRVAYMLAACASTGVLLFAGIVLIGFYYFFVNEAIPPTVDRIQYSMLLLAGLSGILALAAFVWLMVLLIRSR